ncbi:MAG: hypothetical protein ACKOBW_04540 [Planctomycetota bacterium]
MAGTAANDADIRGRGAGVGDAHQPRAKPPPQQEQDDLGGQTKNSWQAVYHAESGGQVRAVVDEAGNCCPLRMPLGMSGCEPTTNQAPVR